MEFAIIPNLTKKEARHLTDDIVSWLKERNHRVWVPEGDEAIIANLDLASMVAKAPFSPEMVIVLGGDGTLLSVARQVAPLDLPVLGVNLGQLGFLTEIDIPHLWGALEKIIAGQYHVEKRMMLEAIVRREGEEIARFLAINDAVVTKGSFARIIRLETYVDDVYLETYPADGVIVSTPTGSTAYSLSAGGPIVNPNLQLLILTPICPHTLYARSVLVTREETIRIVIHAGQGEVMLTIDGQYGFRLAEDDRVIVRQAATYAKLVRLNDRSFYEVLREKLREGRSLGGNQV